MKRQKFKRMLGIKSAFMVPSASSSRSTRPKFILGAFWKTTLKGKLRMRKVGAQDLTIQNLQTQVIEIKLWKEHEVRKEGNQDLTIQKFTIAGDWKETMKRKGDEKSRNPRSTIQRSFSLVLCHDSCAKLKIEYALEPWKDRNFKGCAELRMYLWCPLPLPPDLPVQSSFLELFERQLWKENCAWEK